MKTQLPADHPPNTAFQWQIYDL